jgi:DNA-binding PadR family transcriptional regulator
LVFSGILFALVGLGLLDATVGMRFRRAKVFSLLATGGPSTGKQLVSRGAASNGVVYVVLCKLEDEGLVLRYDDDSLSEDDFVKRGHRPRYVYELTEKGRAATDAQALKGTIR